MQIALAQISPVAGDIPVNTGLHLSAIEKAAALGAEAIFFPELSLTGYEPMLADELALSTDSEKLTVFAEMANRYRMTIAPGLPLRTAGGVQIAKAIFQARTGTQVLCEAAATRR